MTDFVPGPADVPFTISCYECDNDGPDSYDDAVKAGWTKIQFTPEGLAENYLGLCPQCAVEENAPECVGGDVSIVGDSNEVSHVTEEIRTQAASGS